MSQEKEAIVKNLISDEAANKAIAELQQIREARVKEASNRINAICEEFKIGLVAQVVIEGTQLNSQVVIVNKG